MRLAWLFVLCSASLAVAVACSGAEAVGSPSGADAGAENGADGGDGAEPPDTGDAADAEEAGEPRRKTTSVEAKINDVSRTLDRAQFGLTKAGSAETLWVEAHEGGIAECPEKQTPKRTLIVRDVPKGAPGDRFTKDDGIGVALLDYAGDQITSGRPTTTATAATVTIVAIDAEASVEIEVEATFAEGTAKGRVYATYCAAMSQ
jgi:hypothetical protein